MEGNPERMSDDVRRMPPLGLPLLRGLAISDRWMPASTPIVPARISTPSMRSSVPRIWSRSPPPVAPSFVHSTLQRQWLAARNRTPSRIQTAGAMIRTKDPYVKARNPIDDMRRRRVAGPGARVVLVVAITPLRRAR